MKLTKYALFDLAQWKNGLAFKKIDFSPTGKPVIKIAELKNGITGQTQFTEADYGEDVHLTNGDMLFSWSGNPETSIDVFWYNLPDGWLNQHIFKITPKPFVDKYFLYYLLKYLKPTFKSMASNKQTTGLGHITIKDLKELIVFLPNIKIQKYIATILCSLDERIQLNNKINDNLQQQICQIYKAWYQNFLTAGNLPMIPTEYGTIPQGWRYVLLDELCSSISVTHKFDSERLIFLNTGDIEDGQFNHSTYMSIKDMPGQAKKSIAQGDILYSEIRPINKHFAYVNFPSNDYVVSTKLMVIRSKSFDSRRLYHYLTSQNVLTELQMQAESRSGTFPQIRFDNIKRLPILIADNITEKTFTTLLHNVYTQIDHNNVESQKLAALRDTLLPNLMSGEIDVSDIAL